MSTRGQEGDGGAAPASGETLNASAEGERDSTLDLPREDLQELARVFNKLTRDYLESAASLPVFPDTSAERLAGLFRGPLPSEGAGLETLERACGEVIANIRHNGHPRMFGYVASPATPVGAFAALLTSALNVNVTSWRSAPAATEIEQVTVGWLAELIGFKGAGRNEGAGGLLTSGGSMANLNALFVAHRSKEAERRERGGEDTATKTSNASRRGLWGAGSPTTIYASDQIHLSVPKAADVLGIGREQVRLVASDEGYRIDVRDLRERIEADAAQGLRPFCVVASAGTVSTGAVDALSEVARVAREHSLWFHVDGAYGALAAADESKRSLFAGIELADSVSLDPHKWLYTPLGCGCLLLREPERARAAFKGTEEDYIKVFEQEEAEAFAFWDYGVELSRPFRALKVWLMLSFYGARRVAEAIAGDISLAAHFGASVEASEDFELLAPVTLGICCFRYASPQTRRALARAGEEERESLNKELDELNARIMHRVQRGGRAYVSNAILRGRFALRASLTNYRTTQRDIEITLETIREAARECL
ncbi:MAG TPA: pyridoxal-dependent decarboxylase [Pyrinomonadaceae bacterium]|nr:pyridoxal-dependent decarboxylase [Pyrinomonadaceae bacterium]